MNEGDIGMTLLETARDGSLEQMQHLAEYESQELKQRDAQGNTLLHYAVMSGDIDKVRYVTEYVNIDPLEANRRGQTSLDLALKAGAQEIAAYLAARAGVTPDNMVHNPVRRGFYPDPSWIRVGDEYYLVNSTFCYFPCLAISRSRDLVHWTTVGYAITNPAWARVLRSEGGRGYWAPDISYDPTSRRYYITATYRGNEHDAEPRCQMVTSAERPEGPYDEPAWIHDDGIDPSIFHDDDGRHYMLFNRSVRMVELTEDCRAMKGKPRLIWGGDWQVKTEGPQMMKRDGYYYILAAEGGTGTGHRISVARSRNIWGPYETSPYNPMIRQHEPEGYLQNCGHGKLLETPDGRWFLCYLCLRRDGDHIAPMGRETSIAEVTWTPDGWPVAVHGRRPMTVLPLPIQSEPVTIGPPAGLVNWKDGEWLTVRALDSDRICVENDVLSLTGNGLDLCDMQAQGILVVRQQERAFTVAAGMDGSAIGSMPVGADMGLTCYYDEHSYLKFGVERTDAGYDILFEEYAGTETITKEHYPLDLRSGDVSLRVAADGERRQFSLQAGGEHWQLIHDMAEPPYLTSEGLKCGKRFTGATVGVYVHGECTARFTDWTEEWVRG